MYWNGRHKAEEGEEGLGKLESLYQKKKNRERKNSNRRRLEKQTEEDGNGCWL